MTWRSPHSRYCYASVRFGDCCVHCLFCLLLDGDFWFWVVMECLKPVFVQCNAFPCHTNLFSCSAKSFASFLDYLWPLRRPQACCLMVFSEEPNALVLGEVSQRLHLPDDIVKRILHSLSCGKYKVLKRDGEGRSIKATEKVCVFPANLCCHDLDR